MNNKQTWESLAKLVRLPRNPKAHDLGAVHVSMDTFGFIDAITVNEVTGRIIGGHGRVDALQQRKAGGQPAPVGIRVENGEWFVPALVVHVPVEQEEAAAIALNRAGELGGWDEAALASVLADLAAQNEELLNATGFDADDLDLLLRDLGTDAEPPPDPGAQINRAEELNETWQVQPGDLWEIPSQATPGKAHRLMCGDSTKSEDVARLMGGEKADAVITDPPYGINHDTDYTRFSGGLSDSRNFGDPIRGDSTPFNPVRLLDYKFVILWGANAYSDKLPCGTWLVWDKRYEGQEKILSDGEVAWFNSGHGVYIFNYTWNGFLREDERGKTLHPTQKPVALFEWCFTYIKSAQLIFDPYCGSGPVMAAAERTGRICYGMEIEPKYIAVALERLAGLGLEPRRVE